MMTEKNKPWLALLAVLVFSLMCGSSVWAEEEGAEMEDPFEGKPPLADQLEQFSNEIARRVHQELQELLDKELKILQEERKKEPLYRRGKNCEARGNHQRRSEKRRSSFCSGRSV